MCKAMEDMRLQERREGREEGREEGQKEKARMVVLRMLAAGKYELEEIADISGMPLDEVKILNDNKIA